MTYLFGSQTWLMLKLFFRDRQSVFWNFGFPVLLQVLFCAVFGRNDPELILFFLSSLLLITIMSGSLYGVGIVIPSQREAGIFRRYRVTPASGWQVVGPGVACRLLVILATVLIQLILSALLFGAAPRGGPWVLAAVIVTGVTVFCLLGLIIANAARAPHIANAMANALLMPMMFLSGAVTPLDKMPAWLQSLSGFLPATYLVDSLRQTLLLESAWRDLAPQLAALAGFGLLFLVIGIRNFKWE